MEWVIEKAKNGINTLKVNGIYIYSKYNPIEDTKCFINNIEEQDFYIVFGLGLGYHIQLLSEKYPNSKIYGYALCEEDLSVFESNGFIPEKFSLINNFSSLDIDEHNIVIPIQWTKAIGENNLTPFFEDIKLRQISRKRWIGKMKENFTYSLSLPEYDLRKLKGLMKQKTLCIVSSGPSLNEMIDILKLSKNKFYILAVTSSLKLLVENGIIPDAIIMSDSKVFVQNHFKDIVIDVPLFYLSTANRETIEAYNGIKIKLYQEGYDLAEERARILNQPLFEVGGSVATLAYSLALYMEPDKIIFFGQDLGFRNEYTHAKNLNVGISVNESFKYMELEANDGEYNNVSKSLYLYWRWFNRKVPLAESKVYNTALQGTKIKGASYVSSDRLIDMINRCIDLDYITVIKNELEEL